MKKKEPKIAYAVKDNLNLMFGQALVDHLVAENIELRAKLAASEAFNKCRSKLDEILIPVAAQSRIAALEGVVRELIDKCEFIGQYIRSDGEPSRGRCPICHAGSLQGKHKPDCEFLKARAVLEGK